MNFWGPSFSSTPARPVVVCYYKTFLKKEKLFLIFSPSLNRSSTAPQGYKYNSISQLQRP